MNIAVAETEAEILACCPVMRTLRPHIPEHQFLAFVRRQTPAGYRLVYAGDATGIAAVAGFRIGENLAWGRFLYVDDLVTLPGHRSKGYGAALLDWLRHHAVRENCRQLHLDSGVQRTEAHRFYEREGMEKTGYHFAEVLAAGSAR